MKPFDQKLDTTILDLWEAYSAPTERISIKNASGRIAASTIRQYPPGIPEIIPGMTYSPRLISNLEGAYKAGSEIIGVDFSTGGFVDVLHHSKKRHHMKTPAIETHLARDIPAAITVEIADFFRVQFSSAPYFHFAFHENDPLTPLPSGIDFGSWKETLDLPTEEQVSNAQAKILVDAIDQEKTSEHDLPEGFHLWTDKHLCRTLIADRLKDPGYVTLVRDPNKGHLLGLLHSRMGSIERLFHSEEWRDPFIFSRYKNVDFMDCSDRFYRKMKEHFNLDQNDQVMTISAQVLAPQIQGGDVFYDMMRSMAESILPAHTELPLLCEIPNQGTAHVLNTAFTDRIIFGALRSEHPLVFCEKTSQALFTFLAERSHWQQILRSNVRSKREFERQHFTCSSTDYPDLEVRENGEMGYAVFATKRIKVGSRIAVFEGETYYADDALSLPEIMRDHAIQTGPKTYVFGYRGLAHCLCHSCEPNCGIRNLTEIFAVQDIHKGEQITWDYRCSENSTWSLDTCLCGSAQCSVVVGNFDSLSPDKRSSYLQRNMVSEWLTNA